MRCRNDLARDPPRPGCLAAATTPKARRDAIAAVRPRNDGGKRISISSLGLEVGRDSTPLKEAKAPPEESRRCLRADLALTSSHGTLVGRRTKR